MLDRVGPDARVEVDLGAGDGSYAYRKARRDPSSFFLAVDANGAAMAERSRRAMAKPARGGAPNVLFVRASATALPEGELAGLVSRLTILYPWGTLLHAVMDPDPGMLASLRRLCREGAELTIVLGLSLEREVTSAGGFRVDEPRLRSLVRPYAAAGFDVRVDELAGTQLEDYETTWSKKLVQDRSRRFFRLAGYCSSKTP